MFFSHVFLVAETSLSYYSFKFFAVDFCLNTFLNFMYVGILLHACLLPSEAAASPETGVQMALRC